DEAVGATPRTSYGFVTTYSASDRLRKKSSRCRNTIFTQIREKPTGGSKMRRGQGFPSAIFSESPAARAVRSELGAAVDMDRVAGDPARVGRSEEGDDVADVIRLGDPLQRLQAEGVVTALVRLGKGRHVGCDHAGRDRVDTNATCTERDG